MRPPPLFRRCVIAVALVAAVGGCGRRVEDPTEVPGLAAGTSGVKFRAYHLQAFHVQQMWAGAGAAEDYRAKVAVWDYSQTEPRVAELYFHDTDRFDQAARHRNPDPDQAKPPFQIHFPTNMLGPMLDTLRTANERVYLYYSRGEWAVGVILPEGIGSG